MLLHLRVVCSDEECAEVVELWVEHLEEADVACACGCGVELVGFGPAAASAVGITRLTVVAGGARPAPAGQLAA